MCTTCGCGNPDNHHHHHDNDHHHHHHDNGNGQETTLRLEADILGENNTHAAWCRGWLAARGVTAVNIVSSPGSGKTSLLEATAKALKGRRQVAVIEGDQHTDNDMRRVAAQGIDAVQINTQNGCHLDAHMVAHAITDLNPATGSLLLIENVGNLVCPAMFDLGERVRVVVLSVTEGDDKPLKYPYMFAGSQVCVINKTDLLPYVDSDIECIKANARQINPDIQFFEVSATKGTGIDKWAEWLLNL